MKNRSLVCGFFLAGIMALAGCSDEAPRESQSVVSNEISGIYIGMPEADMLANLGEPVQRDIIFKDLHDIQYEGLRITLRVNGPSLDGPKFVDGIWTSSPEHCFRGVICPGDKLDVIRKTLGPADINLATKDKPKRLNYLLPELETCWLWIYTQDELTASDVRIACQP